MNYVQKKENMSIKTRALTQCTKMPNLPKSEGALIVFKCSILCNLIKKTVKITEWSLHLIECSCCLTNNFD